MRHQQQAGSLIRSRPVLLPYQADSNREGRGESERKMETYINPITVCSTLSREGNVPVLFWMVMARRWVGYVVGPFSSLLTGGTSRCKLSYECIVSGSSSYVHASAPSAAQFQQGPHTTHNHHPPQIGWSPQRNTDSCVRCPPARHALYVLLLLSSEHLAQHA